LIFWFFISRYLSRLDNLRDWSYDSGCNWLNIATFRSFHYLRFRNNRFCFFEPIDILKIIGSMMIVILTVSIVPAAIIIVRAFCFTLYKILTVVALVFGDDRLF